MPPKRKTETPAEPSPPPKKRASKASTASEKKRSRDESADVPAKGRRKKKLDEVEEETEEVPTTPVAETPKQKKSTKQVATPKSARERTPEPTTPATALKSATKPRSSRKSIVRIDLPPEPSSGKKSATASPVSAPAAKGPAKTRTPLRIPTTPVPPEKAGESGPDDEKEIVSLWNQTSGALHMSLSMIGPPFLFIILACYFMGMMQKSQAIASVGVVYAFLFMTIMGSYVLVIVPCILVSRLFTCLVSSKTCNDAEVNLYARLLVLCAAAAGLGYYFLHCA